MTYAASHNGGLTQVNLNFLLNGGEFPFINQMLQASSWSPKNGVNTPVTPDMLNSDGWPISNTNALGVDCAGVNCIFFVPPQTSRSGNYKITWQDTGTHTISLGFSQTSVSGSLTSSGGVGSYVFAPSSNRFSIGIPAGISNVKVFHVSDETDLNNGEVYTRDFKNRLLEGRFGVIRFLNWLGGVTAGTNNANLSTWSTRKPLTHWAYCAHELRPSLFGGVATSAGLAYSVSQPSIHSSDGSTWNPGDAPKDQDTVIIVFGNGYTASVTAAVSSSTSTVLTIATAAPNANFNLVGETVTIAGVTGAWSSMNGSRTVTAAGSGSVTISFDSSALTPGGLSGTVTIAHSTPTTIDVGSTGAQKTMLNWYGATPTGSYFPVSGGGGTLATLTWDATLNGWVKYGGGSGEGSIGLRNGVPPEACFRLCAEVGAHPHFTAPHQGAHIPSDWSRQLATYCAANQPSWMIPRFEGPNELWNFATNCTQYAMQIATAYTWGTDYHNWYGRVLSLAGQDVAAAYGVSQANVKTQTKYQILCGVQTGYGDSTIDTNTHNPRLSSAKFLLQAAPAGYQLSAASNWTTTICCAQYWDPSDFVSNTELASAYSFAASGFTDTSYVQTFIDGAVTGSGNLNLNAELAYYTRWKAWAQTFGIQKMCGYEGGYSPDYVAAGVNTAVPAAPFMTITGATAANPCVLTVPNTSYQGRNNLSNSTTSSAIVGMAIRIQSHGGTQGAFLNNPSETVTFSGSGSANISGANTLRVNQAVWFSTSGTLPNELSEINLPITTSNGSTHTSKPYYVVSAGNPFQISETKGGTPITFNSTGTGTQTAQEGWFVTAVGSGTITIDADASSAGAFTTGGQAAHYAGDVISMRFRYAGKHVWSTALNGTGMLGYTILNYKNFCGLSDGTFTAEFPSCFQLGGPTPSAYSWSILEDLYQTPNPPQFEAIRLFNNRKRRLVW